MIACAGRRTLTAQGRSQRGGARPAAVVLTEQASFAVSPADPVRAADARSRAFSDLSARLGEEAAVWLTTAPPGASP